MRAYRGYIVSAKDESNVGVIDVMMEGDGDPRSMIDDDLKSGEKVDQVVEVDFSSSSDFQPGRHDFGA